MLVNTVPSAQQGIGFGIKGAAAPFASAMAGALVPVAVAVGWRWAFGAAALIAIAVIPLFGKRPPPSARITVARGSGTELRNPGLVLFVAVVFGFGVASSMMVSVFYVDAAVAGGTSARTAGLILATGSIASVAARVLTGSFSDRMSGNHMELCAYMQFGGLFGVVMLTTGNSVLMGVGLVIGLIGTWGPNAVFWYALTRHYQDAPGRITGAVQPGAAVGAVVGPATFGLLADHASYQSAWTFCACITLVASIGTFVAARQLAARSAAPAVRSS
jgi:predicted MFS family arabinose efflux permease